MEPSFMPPKHAAAEKNKEPLPKHLKEVPQYLIRLISSFFSRLFYIFRLVWETKPLILILMIAAAAANGLLPIFGAYISAEIINALAENLSGRAVTAAAIGMLFGYQFLYLFLNRIVNDINHMVSSLSGEMITNHIRRKIMQKAKEIDVSCFDQPDFYEKLENANREAGMRPVQVLNSSLTVISTLISMISFIAVLAAIGLWAPFLVIILAVPSAVISFIYRRKTVGYMRRRSKARRQMNYYSEAVVDKDLVKEIRLLGISGDFEKRYDAVFKDYFKGLKRIILSEGAWNIAFGIVRIATNCLLFWFIAAMALNHQIQVGDYALYTGALNSIAVGVASLVSSTAVIYEGTLFIDNLISFMKQEKKIIAEETPPLLPERHVGHTIEFKNVSFQYPQTERYVLKNVNLKFEAGETIVLVGLNGAGKTTLIKLLTRLYDPTAGQILLDGKDIRRYDVQALYHIFGIVFQDFGKYAVTVEENILFGNIQQAPDKARVEEAARQSDSLGYIRTLPQGFDTPLMRYFEENGLELSIGQWQKLAVARAFYGDSDILVLDEPTASLDALAEQEIYNQFDQLRKGKTTIFVSHRLSSAVGADRILVLENGSVIEEGTHRQLMQQQGKYYQMFSTQAKRYRE